MSNQPPISMMYQSQMPAYSAHSAYNAHVSNSTPTSPPEVTPTDITAACTKKKNVVNALPIKCSHCPAALSHEDNCFNEMKDGSVIAYCRAKGGCGRSQVLFVAPELSIPKYKQVCVFEEDTTKPNGSTADHTALMRMHGVTINGAVCKKCEKTYESHEKGYDTNGWVQCGEDIIKLPSDWPVWNASAKTWK